MAVYKLLRAGGVLRLLDGACIPDDPRNADQQQYQDWLKAGNAPDPADPAPVDPPDAEKDAMQTILAKADVDITAGEVKTLILKLARRLAARGGL